MGIKGRQRVQDKFSSSMIISKTLKTYHDVVQDDVTQEITASCKSNTSEAVAF